MRSLVRTVLIAFEALRSAVIIILKFIAWCFTNKFTGTVFSIVVIALVSWAVGFYLYVDGIDKTRNELISSEPEFANKTDAIVVLTGGSERIKHAIFLLNLGYANKLFISGVNKEVKLNEILYLHGYHGQDMARLSKQIELGYSAVDTIQNADEIAIWAKKNNIRSIRLVTSNYHIKRAMLEMQYELPDVKIIPHGVVPLNIRIDRWWDFESTRDLLLSEYNKYLAANLRIFLEKFRMGN